MWPRNPTRERGTNEKGTMRNVGLTIIDVSKPRVLSSLENIDVHISVEVSPEGRSRA